jgi:hypothetical protein
LHQLDVYRVHAEEELSWLRELVCLLLVERVKEQTQVG